jgi:hypothetical protein
MLTSRTLVVLFDENDQQNSKSKDQKLMQSQTMVFKATAPLLFYENVI